MGDYGAFWGHATNASKVIEMSPEKIRAAQMEYLSEHQEAAAVFVKELKKILERKEKEALLSFTKVLHAKIIFHSFVTEKVSEETGSSFSSSVFEVSSMQDNIFFYLSMLMDGTKREDFKDCAYCGKLFLQVSREKKFCTRNCAANSAKG